VETCQREGEGAAYFNNFKYIVYYTWAPVGGVKTSHLSPPLDFEKKIKIEEKIYTENKNIFKCGTIYILRWGQPGS
jgi:hypothetical protein